jgi:hypothetical protein
LFGRLPSPKKEETLLAYRDFVPRAVPMPGGVLNKYFNICTFETFDDALAAANSWIAAESVQVVTVETVVLPNIPNIRSSSSAQGTAVTEMQASGYGGAHWYQFVRVWYEK